LLYGLTVWVHCNILNAKINVLPIEQEMIPPRNATDMHVHEELQLPILKAFPQCTCLYTLFEIIEVSCVCVCVCVCKDGSRTVCRSHQHPSSPSYDQKSPARRQTCPPPWRDHPFVCGLYTMYRETVHTSYSTAYIYLERPIRACRLGKNRPVL
jgi:hypothetical protein